MKKLLNRRVQVTSVDNQCMYVTRDITVIRGEKSCTVGSQTLILFDGCLEDIEYSNDTAFVVETYFASTDVSRETFDVVKHHKQRPYHKVKFVP